MAPNITFNTIDTASRVPRVAMEFDSTSGVRNLPVNAKKMLIVGQRLAAGTVLANVPTPIARSTDGEGYFGAGGSLDAGIKAALLANPNVDLTAVAMDDAGGSTAATETLTIVGTATGLGAHQLDIADKTYSSGIAVNDTVTVQAAALRDVINADAAALVVATAAAGVLTLTSKSKGLIANDILLANRITGAPGITSAILSNAGSGGRLSGGTGACDPTAALASAAGARYHDVVLLLDDTVAATAGRDSVNAQGAAEVGFGEVSMSAKNGTLSACTTQTNALNGPRTMVAALKDSPSWVVQIAAAFGAVVQSEAVPNRPFNGLVLNGIKPPPVASRWTPTDKKTLLANGCTPLMVIPGELVAISRAESTRTKNAAAITDMSQSDITVIQSFDYVRDSVTLMFTTLYGRSRWADEDPDGLLPSDVATPVKVKGSLIGTMDALQGLGIVEGVDKMLDLFLVNKVGTNCQFEIPTDIVEGLHEIYGKSVLVQSNIL